MAKGGVWFIGTIVSGCLLAGAFPPFNFWPFIWIGLVPLLLVLPRGGNWLGFLSGWVTGSVYFSVSLSWVFHAPVVHASDFAALVGYLSCYVGIFASGVVTLKGLPFPFQLFGVPSLWVVLEYIRGHAGFLAFPLGHVGYSQAFVLPISQVGSLAGVYGVSCLIILINVVVSEWIRHPKEHLKPVLFSLAFVGALGIWGWNQMSVQPSNIRVQAAVIPGSIPQDERWNPVLAHKVYEKFVTGSLQVAQNVESLNIIAWPETAVMPFAMGSREAPFTLEGLARTTGAYLVVGLAEQIKFHEGRSPSKGKFNSALLVDSSGRIAGRYHKIRLFPFGEYLPYREWIPWPDRASTKSGDMQPGSDYSVFPLTLPDGQTIPISMLICWEMAFPDLVREFTTRGAGLLVNGSNEAWFRKGGFAEQMMAVNVFRAIENRVSIVRSANFGWSGFIDPWGRLLGTLGPDEGSTSENFWLSRELPVYLITTPYTRFGDVLVFGSASLLIGGGLWMGLQVFKRKGWSHGINKKRGNPKRLSVGHSNGGVGLTRRRWEGMGH